MPCRLEVNGLASVGEAQRIATDFWQLHAPAGAPLGARDILRSHSPARGAADSGCQDPSEETEAADPKTACSTNDEYGAGLMNTESSQQFVEAKVPRAAAGPAAATAVAPAILCAASVPAPDDSSDIGSSVPGGGGRWRIEWRRQGGTRAAAQYVPPLGAHLRLMLLSVADGARVWQ